RGEPGVDPGGVGRRRPREHEEGAADERRQGEGADDVLRGVAEEPRAPSRRADRHRRARYASPLRRTNRRAGHRAGRTPGGGGLASLRSSEAVGGIVEERTPNEVLELVATEGVEFVDLRFCDLP